MIQKGLEDVNHALQLDNKYFKAYIRGAEAYSMLG